MWSTPNDYELTEFASSVTPRLYDRLFELTRIPDPMPKEDLVPVPAFKFLGMENWGLMVFRESGLLDYPRNLSLTDKSRQRAVAALISHELSHIWFGNLVTAGDWSWSWLHEGFANHLEHFVTHDVMPELELDEEHQVLYLVIKASLLHRSL